MKKAIISLCVLAALAACESEDAAPGGAAWDDGVPREIGFSGAVFLRDIANGLPEDSFEVLTADYGTVYVRHTRNGSYAQGEYKDAATDTLWLGMNIGDLQQKNGYDSVWYWGPMDTLHVFHAWTLPADEPHEGKDDDTKVVTLDDSCRYGTVDLSMDRKSSTVKDSLKILSNLEYFIGAVWGPSSLRKNGSTRARLDFRHLVAKIIVEDILYIESDGTAKSTGNVEFSMPNMPNKAYWTTGVPTRSERYDLHEVAGQTPRLLDIDDNPPKGFAPLEEKDYGVSGILKEKGWCFYIYPCMFADKNPLGKEMGEIEFRYTDPISNIEKCYYGTLDALTDTLPGLRAGECMALKLLLEAGEVGGIHPHIVDWNTSPGETDAEQHDRPGIYDEADWQKYVDWVNECGEAEKNNKPLPEPPAGLFDKDGNLNLYNDLDLRSLNSKYASPPDLRFPEGGKLKGNGHRVKTSSGWSAHQDDLDDVYVFSTNDSKTEHYGN